MESQKDRLYILNMEILKKKEMMTNIGVVQHTSAAAA